MEYKIEKKNFGIAEFKEEEFWLEKEHKDGWRLIQTNRAKYQFEKCDADQWVYQLDFKENGVAEEEYIQMFVDCGWEYVLKYGEWCYFRRKKEEGTDLSIFSDRFSKIDMYTRIIQSRHLRFTIMLFVIGCLIQWLAIFTDTFNGDGFWDSAMPWIGCSFFVATSFSAQQYIRLKKMVEELKLPEEE